MAVIVEDHISEEIHQLKVDANTKFQARDYDSALAIYLDILARLPARSSQSSSQSKAHQAETQQVNERLETQQESESSSDDDANEAGTSIREEAQIRTFRAVVYANIAAVHLRLEQYRDAVKSCNQSLLDEPEYVKALYRRAQANECIGGWSGYSSALEDNKKLLHSKDLPASTRPSVLAAVKRLEPLVEEAANKEKDEMMQKLKGLGDSILGNFGLSTNNFKFTQQPGGGYSMNFVR